jgi:hypothetical protein
VNAGTLDAAQQRGTKNSAYYQWAAHAVRNDVMRETQNKQVPWEHSALRARFYFVTPESPPTQGVMDGTWIGFWPAGSTASIAIKGKTVVRYVWRGRNFPIVRSSVTGSQGNFESINSKFAFSLVEDKLVAHYAGKLGPQVATFTLEGQANAELKDAYLKSTREQRAEDREKSRKRR